MLKIIICGARVFNDYERLKEVCDNVVSKFQYDGYFPTLDMVEVISGCAKGTDLLGERWAREYFQWKNKKRLTIGIKKFPLRKEHWADMEVRPDNDVFPKTWSDGTVYNVLAGANRNARMLDYALMDGDIAIVIAFYKGDSKGSKQMVKICKKAGVDHFIWDDKKQKMRK